MVRGREGGGEEINMKTRVVARINRYYPMYYNLLKNTLKSRNVICSMSVLYFHGRALLLPIIIALLLPGCYLSFPANKLVSGEHCKIVQDEISGLVWLEDMRYCMLNIHPSEIKTAVQNRSSICLFPDGMS